MGGRQINHEGHDKCSDYLESNAEGRIRHGEGRAGGGLMRMFAAKDKAPGRDPQPSNCKRGVWGAYLGGRHRLLV